MSDRTKSARVSQRPTENLPLRHRRTEPIAPRAASLLKLDPSLLIDEKTVSWPRWDCLLENGQVAFTLTNVEFAAIRNGDAVTAYFTSSCTTVWGSTFDPDVHTNFGLIMQVSFLDANGHVIPDPWPFENITECKDSNAPFGHTGPMDLVVYEAAVMAGLGLNPNGNVNFWKC